MGRVFISYAHEDEAKARKIKERLEEFGFKTWIDRTAPASRDDISTVIDAQIQGMDSVLVLWSAASMKSVWVRGEALRGLEGNKYFGVLLNPQVPPVPFNAMLAPDLSDWSGLNDHLGWDALVRGLASMGERTEAILAKLEKLQLAERSQQPDLPLDLPPEEPLDEGPGYSDVDAILRAAKSVLGSSTKLNLGASLTQAALDIEMLRDAKFVVCAGITPERPGGASFSVVSSLQQAVDQARDGDLIVMQPGTYKECVRITKRVRVVGLGQGAARATLAAASARAAALSLGESARIENISIETRLENYAVCCEKGRPAILRCDIRRFSKNRDENDAALYIQGRANPIVVASSVASTGSTAVYLVSTSGGEFVGASIVALRGAAVKCRGRADFLGCSIEAIGNHAVEVLNNGHPVFDSCEISGRGATVVAVKNSGRPRIKESRLSAIRQFAFDFSEQATGRYEGNIVAIEGGDDAGTGRKAESGFFAIFQSKQDAMVRSARQSVEFARLRGTGKPIFIANTTPDGVALKEPAAR